MTKAELKEHLFKEAYKNDEMRKFFRDHEDNARADVYRHGWAVLYDIIENEGWEDDYIEYQLEQYREGQYDR